jgi:hypothetical protein
MNVADVLTYGHDMVLRAVDGLAEPDWLTPGVCGSWTVKHVVAHLASVELLIADVVGTFVASGPTPHLDAFNRKDRQHNDEEVARRRDWSAASTLGEYTEAAKRVREVASRVPQEKVREPATMPWYGKEYALDDFLVYTSYGHKAEHCAQIAVFRDRLKARGTVAR